jgi:ABC-2 type transport system ATP-binding protein
MTPIIVAERLTKSYGPRIAVDSVSLEVETGEVMGLLGPNGSGKTTILRILTGYLRASSGTARIAGLDIARDALAVKQRVGYVPENAPLYDGMRVREFLAFMARIKGLAGSAVPPAVEAACARLALEPVVDRQVGTLSKGFRQRVAIAQALLGRPAVLILDEPGNGLDPKQIIEMRGLIRSLAGSLTILVTSHILAEMERMADRVAILVQGRLLAVRVLRSAGAAVRLRLRVRGDEALVRACLGRVPGVHSRRTRGARTQRRGRLPRRGRRPVGRRADRGPAGPGRLRASEPRRGHGGPGGALPRAHGGAAAAPSPEMA